MSLKSFSRNLSRKTTLFKPKVTREDAAEGSRFPKITQFSNKISFYFDILIHQGHTKIIINFKIAIAITIISTKNIISIMMMMTKTQRICQRWIYQ